MSSARRIYEIAWTCSVTHAAEFQTKRVKVGMGPRSLRSHERRTLHGGRYQERAQVNPEAEEVLELLRGLRCITGFNPEPEKNASAGSNQDEGIRIENVLP